jgi:hypothetical protein
VIDPTGRFVREIVLTEPGGTPSPIAVSARLADGRLLGTRGESFSMEAMPSGGVQRLGLVFTAVSPEDGAVDTLATVPGSERAISVQQTAGTIRSIQILSPPFAKDVSYTTSGGLLYVASKDAPEIHVYDEGGRLTRIVRTGTTLQPVTEAHLEAWVERALADVDADDRQERRDALVAIGRDVVPPYGAIETDAAGNLWVEDYDDRLALAGRWTVFDAEGRFVARIALPAGLRVHDIGDDWLLGVERDDLDVERVRLYHLRRHAHPSPSPSPSPD